MHFKLSRGLTRNAPCLCMLVGTSYKQRHCLSVPLAISNIRRPNFTKFAAHVTCFLVPSFSDGNAICYILPVLWMTSRFHIMEGIGQIKDEAYVYFSSPGGGTGVEVCRLRLHLVQMMRMRV